MRTPILRAVCALILAAAAAPGAPLAQQAPDGIARQLLAREALPNVPGHVLTAATVRLPPGKVAAPHRHEAFVFVYLLRGNVRSQLDGEAPVDYAAGDSWIEPPHALHSLTQNLSESEAAELLVVFISRDKDRLTTSGPIAQ